MKKLFLIFSTGFLFSCNSNKPSENSGPLSPDSTSVSSQPSSLNGGTYADSTATSSDANRNSTSRRDSASVNNRDSVRLR